MIDKKQNRNAYLIKNTSIFALGSLATKLITFFLVPLYTNILSTQEYGIVDFVTTIATVFAPIVIVNISEGVMRFSLDKNANYTKIMSIGLALFGVAICLSFAIIPFAMMSRTIGVYSIYIYFYTITLAGSQLFLSYLRGLERLLMYSIGNILHTLFVAGLNILFLVGLNKGIEGYLTAYILANFVTIIYAFFAGNVVSVIKCFSIDKKLAIDMCRYSVVLIPNSFMWWIMNSSDRVMVTVMIGAAANGIYAISYKIPTLIQTITSVFNQAWVYSAIRENDSEDRDAYSNTIYEGMFAFAILSGCFIIAIIKPFLKIYVEHSFYEAWRYTPFLVFGFVFLTLSTFLATSYTVNKDSKGYLFSASIGAASNVLLNILLIPHFGVYGAAFATGISYIIVFMYRAVDTRKYVIIYVLKVRYITALVIMLLLSITIYWDNTYAIAFTIGCFVLEAVLLRKPWISLARSIIIKLKCKSE